MTEKPDEAARSGPTTDESSETDNTVAGGTGYPFDLEPEDREEIEDDLGRLALEASDDTVIVDEAATVVPVDEEPTVDEPLPPRYHSERAARDFVNPTDEEASE